MKRSRVEDMFSEIMPLIKGMQFAEERRWYIKNYAIVRARALKIGTPSAMEALKKYAKKARRYNLTEDDMLMDLLKTHMAEGSPFGLHSFIELLAEIRREENMFPDMETDLMSSLVSSAEIRRIIRHSYGMTDEDIDMELLKL